MADEMRLRCGDRVRVIGPAATSAGDTFAIGKETTVAELRTDDEGHTVYVCQIRGWGFVAFPRASLERLDATAQAADEPRAIVRAFARAMERKLAANDSVKGGWRVATKRADMMRWKALRHLVALRNEIGELEQAVIAMDSLQKEANAEQVHNILMEAADVANYAMMIADVCGALPPTDERGR